MRFFITNNVRKLGHDNKDRKIPDELRHNDMYVRASTDLLSTMD